MSQNFIIIGNEEEITSQLKTMVKSFGEVAFFESPNKAITSLDDHQFEHLFIVAKDPDSTIFSFMRTYSEKLLFSKDASLYFISKEEPDEDAKIKLMSLGLENFISWPLKEEHISELISPQEEVKKAA